MPFEAVPLVTIRDGKPIFDSIEEIADRVEEIVGGDPNNYIGQIAVRAGQESDHPMERNVIHTEEGYLILVEQRTD